MVVSVDGRKLDKYGVEQMALKMRHRILEMSLRCEGPTHLGGGLSLVEIMAVLYGSVMNIRPDDPHWDDRDRFILSKGHGVLALYTALAEVGLISEEEFRTFKENDSNLISHPVMNLDLGIESSNGSLGQGLSMAVGLAWAARRKGQTHSIYVVMGDGECNEGSVWEAAMSAAQFHLGNLVAVVDNNNFQSDGASEEIISASNLSSKWRSFGWNVVDVDGHDVEKLLESLSTLHADTVPTCVVAHTIKGKGVDFMESNNEWHHNRLTQASYEKAIASLEGRD
jgi:transketolase